MKPSAPLRVLVVDDEAPARRKVLRLLRQEPDVQIIGEADSGKTAVTAIQNLEPNLVFLDVQMPGQDGFSVIESIGTDNMPPVVFITAHDHFALRAFEVHAFDYLLKPFTEDRFKQVLRRVREVHARSTEHLASRLTEMLQALQKHNAFPDRILVEADSRAYFVAVSEISWIEADGNYVLLHCGTQNHTLRSTLENLQNSLDPKLFVRINRSALVRLDFIHELQPWFHGEYKVILKNKTELRWTRRYVGQRPELLRFA
ncbi:MAG TPA: LytTR family DNA-binding domain-containing protein [Candidatus Dormibacteraeota bacterium]|jgi:two-component system LytT family response regulator|nr:LytTR family DNA-binding domain-containing protein [Candidatus Dormibacteraeota bacterium]